MRAQKETYEMIGTFERAEVEQNILRQMLHMEVPIKDQDHLYTML